MTNIIKIVEECVGEIWADELPAEFKYLADNKDPNEPIILSPDQTLEIFKHQCKNSNLKFKILNPENCNGNFDVEISGTRQDLITYWFIGVCGWIDLNKINEYIDYSIA